MFPLASQFLNQSLAAHLETGRISNLPTVWSNVLLAYTLTSSTLYLSHVILLALAGSFLYVGGCYLGDARDVAFDKANKPSRPIPAGILKERNIWILGTLMVLIGLAIPGVIWQPQNLLLGHLPLALVITIYALFHKKSAWLGLPLIGACRALLVFSAAVISSNINFSIGLIAMAIGVYTICFASVARLESSDKKISAPNLLKGIMLVLPFASLSQWDSFLQGWLFFVITYLIYALWLGSTFSKIHQNKGAYVSQCLAGFALLDATILMPHSLFNSVLCLGLFCLALLLQKYSPAT